MARVTVEDCLLRVRNRFELVHLAAKRTRQILKGARPLIETTNKAPVTALREIADGFVRPVIAVITLEGTAPALAADANV